MWKGSCLTWMVFVFVKQMLVVNIPWLSVCSYFFYIGIAIQNALGGSKEWRKGKLRQQTWRILRGCFIIGTCPNNIENRLMHHKFGECSVESSELGATLLAYFASENRRLPFQTSMVILVVSAMRFIHSTCGGSRMKMWLGCILGVGRVDPKLDWLSRCAPLKTTWFAF